MLGKLLCLLTLAGSLAAQDEIKQLSDPDPDVRCRAAERLGEQGAASSVPALIDAAFDPSSSVSAAAIDALARIGPPARAAVPRLEELVLANAGFLKRVDRAIRSTGRPEPELPALVSWLRKKSQLDEKVDTLDGIGREKVQVLLVALRDGDARVQGQAALMLGLRASYSPAVVTALLALRAHESAYVRGHVFRALVKDGETAAAVFVEELEHDELAVRRLAALALQRMGRGAKVAMSALIRAIQDEDLIVRRRAIAAIGEQRKAPKEAVAALAAVLEAKDVRLYSTVARACMLLGRDAAPATMALGGLLELDDANLRALACDALAGIGPAAAPATPALIQACYDEIWTVAYSALRALQQIGPAAAAAAPYVAELGEAHPYGTGSAAPALHALGAGKPLPPQPKAEDLPRLLQQLADDDPDVAGKAAFAIGRLAPQDEASRTALILALKRETPYARRHASLALRRIGPSCAVALMDVLAQRPVVARRLAADVLRELASEIGVAALPAWRRALTDPDAFVRASACSSLGLIGAPARVAIPGLVAALKDEDITVARSAAWSLGNMKSAATGAVGALTAVLIEREGQSFGWMILVALGEIGAASESAIPTIREVVRRDPSLRQPAVEALVKIGPSGHAALVEMIRDERGFTRRFALERLLQSGSQPPGLRAALEQAAQDEDEMTRRTALVALQRLKPDGESSIAALIASLRHEQLRALRHSQVPTALAAQAKPRELFELAVHPDERVRWAALRALALKKAEYNEADRERIRNLVRGRLEDKSAMVRQGAGGLLQRVPPAEVTPDMIRWAGETADVSSRYAIATALATVGVRAVPALNRALAGDDRAMRIGAASVVAALGPVAMATAPALSNSLLENDEDARFYARALIALGGDALRVWITTYAGVQDRTAAMLLSRAIRKQGAAAVPHLEKLRAGGKDTTRSWAVATLSQIGEPALDSLLAAASDTEVQIARLAIGGLGRIRDQVPRIAPVLVRALRRRDVRSAAAGALRGQGEAAFPYLEKAADDDDAGTRAGAYAALASFGERAVPLLRRGVADVDKEARVAAVRAAGSLNTALVPELINALRDENGSVRTMAASALGRVKPVPGAALPELLRAFRVGSRSERRATHRALVALKAAPSIAPLLADDDRALRSDAASLLLEMRTDAVPSVAALIRSHDDPARKKAVAVLARIGAQDVLVALLRDKSPEVRAAVAHGLGGMRARARGAVPNLIEALDDSDAAVRKEALWALGEIGPAAEEAIPALRARIKASEDKARETAIAVLARLGAWDDLAELLLDQDPAVRAAAARSLGTMGQRARDAVPALVEVLKDSDAVVTQEALRALGQIGPAAKAAIPALLVWIRTHKDSTRQSAVAALVRIGARDALVELLRAKDRRVRASAARGLGRMRPKAQAAVPALIEALGDRDAAVSKAAVRALGEIGPGAAAAIPALRALHGKGSHVMLVEATLAKIHGGR